MLPRLLCSGVKRGEWWAENNPRGGGRRRSEYAQAEAPAEEEDDNPVGDGQAGHVNDARGPDQGGNGGNDGNGGPPNDGAPPPMPVA